MSNLTLAQTAAADNTYYAVYGASVEGRATRLETGHFLFVADGAPEGEGRLTVDANDPALHLAGLCALADAQRAADQEEARQAHPRHSAVQAVAERARASLGAASHSRIAKAVEIVLSGGVHLNDDGHTAVVESQSEPLKGYAVNGACPCPDMACAPMGLCKHRIAAHMLRRVLELTTPLKEEPADVPTYAPQEVAVVAQEALCLPEAPVSVNTFVEIKGHRVQVTLRGTNDQAVLARLEALLEKYA